MNVSTAKEVWIVQIMSDGTRQTIHTSLNSNYLCELGVSLKKGHFFDLDRLQYVKYRKDAVEVQYFFEPPLFDSEVLRFASRFI